MECFMEQQRKSEQEIRQHRLGSIIQRYFAYDNDEVVRAIRAATGQEVSVRSIQSWLIDPKRSSYRAVPEWVIRGLEDYIRSPENQEKLGLHVERVNSKRLRPKQIYDWAGEVQSRRAVDIATRHIEWDNHEKARWCELIGKVGGEAIADAFIAQRSQISSMSKMLSAIYIALDNCDTFEAFKKHIIEGEREADMVDFFVREAREALEGNLGEFSNPEGLPVPTK